MMPTLQRPRCSLTVAVIGNRRFADESDPVATADAAAMKVEAARACEAAWRQLLTQLPRILDETVRSEAGVVKLRELFNGEPPLVIVASNLAAGADQIGAEAALTAAADQRAVQVVLDAILPFSDDQYPGHAPEFRPDEVARLRSLAGRARTVVRLDANYANQDEHVEAYRHASEALLARADMLMAIYDPAKAGKAAGTIETIARAEAAGIPVMSVLVSTGGAHADSNVRELLLAALSRSRGPGMRFLAARED